MTTIFKIILLPALSILHPSSIEETTPESFRDLYISHGVSGRMLSLLVYMSFQINHIILESRVILKVWFSSESLHEVSSCLI